MSRTRGSEKSIISTIWPPATRSTATEIRRYEAEPGRIGDPEVRMQQPGHRLRIPLLERCDVLPRDRPLLLRGGGVRRPGRAVRVLGSAHRRACPLQSALHGGDADTDGPRRLVGRQAEHPPQYQYGPLPGGQHLQGREEGELDRLSPDGLFTGVALAGLAAQEPVRDRLQPPAVGGERTILLSPVHRSGDVEREDAALALLKKGQAHIRGDPVEPGPDRRLAPKGRPPAPRPEQGLLQQILRLHERSAHPVAVQPQLTPVRLNRLGERWTTAGIDPRRPARRHQSAHPTSTGSLSSSTPNTASTPARTSRASSMRSAVDAPPRLVSASVCLVDSDTRPPGPA